MKATQTEIKQTKTSNFRPGTLQIKVIGARLAGTALRDDMSTFVVIEMHNLP